MDRPSQWFLWRSCCALFPTYAEAQAAKRRQAAERAELLEGAASMLVAAQNSVRLQKGTKTNTRVGLIILALLGLIAVAVVPGSVERAEQAAEVHWNSREGAK